MVKYTHSRKGVQTMPTKKYNTPEERKKGKLDLESQWRKKHNKIISVRFNIESDKAILDQIAKQKNKADYIRKLVLKDIEDNN